MIGRRWVLERVWGLAAGAAVTTLVTLVYASGGFDRLSLAGLDFAFRHLNRIDADPRIVMIDINDSAIEQIGRWPWPRSLYAELVDTLHESGARVIAMDVVFAEPMKPRLEHPKLSENYDVDPPRVVLGDLSLDDAIRDDDELEEAIRRAGNVWLAMFCKLAEPRDRVDRVDAVARSLFAQNPQADLPTFLVETGLEQRDTTEELYRVQRIAVALEKDFSAGVEELSERLKTPPGQIERDWAEAKRVAARRLAVAFLELQPQADFAQFLERVLPDQAEDDDSPDRRELVRGYRTARSLRASLRGTEMPSELSGSLAHGWDVTPPLDKFASAARGTSIVTFVPDRVDGVLRRVPPVLDVHGALVPHLGMAVACDVLDIDLKSAAIDAETLLLADRSGRRHWRVPMDDTGQALINWHVTQRNPQWTASFTHVPAARVMEIPLNRRAIAENEASLALTMAEAVALRFADTPAAYAEYVALVRSRRKTADEGRPIEPAVQEPIGAIERETLHWLTYMNQSIANVEPGDEREAAEFATFRRLHERLVTGRLADDVRRKNERLVARNAQLEAELHAAIEGSVCFVGYTASAVADTVNTPVFDNTPGVMAHANLFNSVVQNRFPRVPSRGVGVAIIIAGGLAVTFLTSSMGPWVSLISTSAVIGVLLSGFGLFTSRVYYLDGVPVAVIGAFMTWAFITLYRQIAEQKRRRQIARSLARQTSPAIAARIARGSTEADLAPQPADVTCYFSDLQGFTTLSEAIGAERTKEVLNRYLGAMSAVLLRHKGSSKFMGDGIFAYFNPPIWPCPDHAAAGCEAALACVDALTALKGSEANGAFAEEFGSLVMRGGIHTGAAFAGTYGSGDRADYTCIGDTVNLASRLESANRAFGTRILVSQATRDAANASFDFRCLGKLQVKGKTHAVPIYELLGRKGVVGSDLLRYAEEFSAAIALFQARQWDGACEAFVRCRQVRADDAAVELYEAELQRLQLDPPPPEWNQAVELTSK